MNPVHIHLFLNHVPVVGTIVGLLLLAAAFAMKSADLKRASLGIFVAMALVAVPVFLTGEPAEERIEDLAGVSKGRIEEHEEAARFALIGMELLGAVALAGLVVFRRAPRIAGGLTAASLVFGLLVSGVVARAANLGGQIRHSEIRGTGPGEPEGDGGDRDERGGERR